MKQVFHHYAEWEDYQSGMYNPPCIESLNTGITTEERIEKAIELLSNKELCFKYMTKVVTEWKISAEQVLTNPSMNGRAWLGQCACFMYARCHDEETRKAWCMLKESICKQANKTADVVIENWKKQYMKDKQGYQYSIFEV